MQSANQKQIYRRRWYVDQVITYNSFLLQRFVFHKRNLLNKLFKIFFKSIQEVLFFVFVSESKCRYFTERRLLLDTWMLTKLWRKKYSSGPRYWNVPVLVNTGTFLVYRYCLKMWYLRSLEHASVIQTLTILEHKNGLVLSNTRVPVSGTWTILFPKKK